jgi:hypothetical protein
LFKLAETTVEHPDGIVKEVVYPVVGQKMALQFGDPALVLRLL